MIIFQKIKNIEGKNRIHYFCGVVEVGLFTNTADVVVLAAPGGCELIRKPTARL